MIFSLKEKKQQLESELQEQWHAEVQQFIELITLGIDPTLLLRADRSQHLVQVGMSSGKAEDPYRHIVSARYSDEDHNSVSIELSVKGREVRAFVVPLHAEKFAIELKSIVDDWKITYK